MSASDITALIARLPEHDDHTASALVSRGVEAVPALIAALRHPDVEIRALARALLIAIGSPALPLLIDNLRDPFRRDALILIMLQIGDPVPLIHALPHAKANVQRYLRVVLQQLPPDDVVQPLLNAYFAAPPPHKMALIAALGMVEHTASIQALLRIVTTDDDQLATHAVLALMEMGNDDVTKALLLTLEHPNEWVATRTFAALIELGHPAGVMLVKHALLSKRETLRVMGVRAVPTLYKQGFLQYDEADDILQKLKRDKAFVVGIAAQEGRARLNHISEVKTLRAQDTSD